MRFHSLLTVLVVVCLASTFGSVSARDAVGPGTGMWQSALTKIKAGGGKDPVGLKPGTALWKKVLPKAKAVGRLDARLTATRNWDDLVAKLVAGGKLKRLDTTKKEWREAVLKAKQTGQLKELSEGKAVKITEAAAQQIQKNPSKWRYVVKALKVTFGVAFVGLLFVGLNAMFTT